MRRGFTLLELMVACLLLGMLVTVLTMVFNQSAIAWRTGTAGVVNLHTARTNMGRQHDVSDAVLPGLKADEDMAYRTVSLWEDGSFAAGGNKRAFAPCTAGFGYKDARTGAEMGAGGSDGGQSVSLFTVGVRSAGPDGIWMTEDDITSWPEEEE